LLPLGLLGLALDAAWIVGFPPLLDLVLMAYTPTRQSVADRVARTVVLDVPRA
jgi:hypothetical protein